MPMTAKRKISLTIDSDLYHRARAQNLYMSKSLSDALTEELQQLERPKWIDANREGLQEINRINAKCGHFSDEHRNF